jgi:hypothetical protein
VSKGAPEQRHANSRVPRLLKKFDGEIQDAAITVRHRKKSLRLYLVSALQSSLADSRN